MVDRPSTASQLVFIILVLVTCKIMEPFRIGICGFGFMGKTHALNVKKNPAASLVSIFSEKKDESEITALGARFHDDWREMIENESLDGIIIATPTFTHMDIALSAFSAGLHVFLEKPMEITVERCGKILHAAKNAGKSLAMGHVLRFDNEYKAMKQAATSGAIGMVKSIRCTRRGPPPGWSSWFFDEEKSGTVILDLTIHDIDYMCWIAGKTPKRVAAVASPLKISGKELFGISHVTLDFDNGPLRDDNPHIDVELGFAEASWGTSSSYPFSTSIEIAGREGLLTCNVPGKHPLEFFNEQGRVAMNSFTNDGYYNEIDDFLVAIKSGKNPGATGVDGIRAVQVCLAALESAKMGKTIPIEVLA